VNGWTGPPLGAGLLSPKSASMFRLMTGSDDNNDSPPPSPSAAADAKPADAVPEGAPSPDQVRLALRKVKDPELNLNIIDLGLVYEVRVDDAVVQIDMTLTSPGCPAGPQIMTDIERAVRAMPGVDDVVLNLIWTPFWTPDRIEPRVRAYMGL
jgi:metal-sulfur cluster biosynthetic enzyme